jgi:hypothetical protein
LKTGTTTVSEFDIGLFSRMEKYPIRVGEQS